MITKYIYTNTNKALLVLEDIPEIVIPFYQNAKKTITFNGEKYAVLGPLSKGSVIVLPKEIADWLSTNFPNIFKIIK